MHIATYEQWITAKAKALLHSTNETEFKCIACFGSGSILDYGEITGQEFDADCPECEGTGLVGFAPDIDVEEIPGSVKKCLTRDLYFSEVMKDLEDLAAFTGQRPIEVLSAHGFVLFCDLRSKWLTHTFNGTVFRRVDTPEVH